MATTMTLIAKQTVGSGGAASVTFNNIPQTYTDLKVVYSARTNAADTSDDLKVLLNGSSASVYSSRNIKGNGSTAFSQSISSTNAPYVGMADGNTSTASTFGNGEFYFPNYTSTSNAKSMSSDAVSETNATSVVSALTAYLWNPATQAAITTIAISPYNGTAFAEFSTFYLYGISNSTTTQNTTVPYASGGDVITTDGTYWYHTFLYSGTFTPLKNLTCDYLVVAGGGASGYRTANDDYYCGGGGGGGLLTSVGTSGGGATAGSPLALTSQSYNVTIGAGGTKVSNTSGTSGGNSVFASITATGGGFGAYNAAAVANGGSGGSGGGATGNDSGGAGGTAISPTQGYAGGTVTGASGTGGAGGGGAGSVGASVTGAQANGGNGGAPLANSITGTSVYYSGGGRGGRGYLASNGSNNANYVYAANRGSGGYVNGGANENGCSGIVVVRYAV